MPNKDTRPYVGVGVIVVKHDTVLMGLRKASHGSGTWNFPGGHLEYGEDILDCARREVWEEAGIRIRNARMGPYTNDIFKQEHKHYITLFVLSDYGYGEVQVREPEKCERWEWFSWENLPSPLFLPIKNLKKNGFHPVR